MRLPDGRRHYTTRCGIRTQWPSGRRTPLYKLQSDSRYLYFQQNDRPLFHLWSKLVILYWSVVHSSSFLVFLEYSFSKENFITVMVKIFVKSGQSLIAKKRVMFGKIEDIILIISDKRSCHFLCSRQKEMIKYFLYMSDTLRVVPGSHFILESTSEKVGSDIEWLWDWICRSTQTDAISNPFWVDIDSKNTSVAWVWTTLNPTLWLAPVPSSGHVECININVKMAGLKLCTTESMLLELTSSQLEITIRGCCYILFHSFWLLPFSSLICLLVLWLRIFIVADKNTKLKCSARKW